MDMDMDGYAWIWIHMNGYKGIWILIWMDIGVHIDE